MFSTQKTNPSSYDLNSSKSDIDILKSRVKKLEQGIILYKEVPIQTEVQLDIVFGKIEELSKGIGAWSLVVDLTEAQLPGHEIRMHIKEQISRLDNRRQISFFTGYTT